MGGREERERGGAGGKKGEGRKEREGGRRRNEC